MQIITNTEQLAELAQSLQSQKFITIDTEFLRTHTYYPQLCLMQIADDHAAYIIDVLAEKLSLEPLFKIFNNTQILKIFHSGRQDLEIIYNLTGKVAFPIFDTQIAASACGYGQSVSYENLCLDLLGVKIDKTYQFTDWSKRPLLPGQLEYAIGDVVYLRKIYLKLMEVLEAAGRLNWIDQATLGLADINNYNTRPEDAWQKISFNDYPAKFVKLVKALASFRDQEARNLNIPRGHVMKDHILTAIASAAPDNLQKFEKIAGVNKHITDAYGERIIATLEAAKQLPEEKIGKAVNHTNSSTSPVVTMLKLLLRIISKEQNVVEKIIASNDELALIANYAHDDIILKNISCMQDWRYDVFGRHALDLKAGRISLTANGNDVIIVINK